ncbi:MAG: TlpA family protein disulfide reductase [Lachnospiraceae bacterium]|nr:TlpA family protein disulfide reductase [Lachnospiraceae bacterium]
MKKKTAFGNYALAALLCLVLLLSGACGKAPEPATRSGIGEDTAAGTSQEEAKTRPEDPGTDQESAETSPEDTAADPERTTAAPETTSSDASEADPDVMMAPELTLYDQYGQFHRLSDYRGKVVFLNFWATWCPPCRAEMPDIQKLYEKYAGADSEVVILGVAMPGYGSEVSEEEVRAFLDENSYTYPTLMDHEGASVLPYYITAYPTTFMIDKSGAVYGYVQGAMSAEIMQQIIDQTLEGGAG